MVNKLTAVFPEAMFPRAFDVRGIADCPQVGLSGFNLSVVQ